MKRRERKMVLLVVVVMEVRVSLSWFAVVRKTLV